MHTALGSSTFLSPAAGDTVHISRRHTGIQDIYPDSILEESAIDWVVANLTTQSENV